MCFIIGRNHVALTNTLEILPNLHSHILKHAFKNGDEMLQVGMISLCTLKYNIAGILIFNY